MNIINEVTVDQSVISELGYHESLSENRIGPDRTDQPTSDISEPVSGKTGDIGDNDETGENDDNGCSSESYPTESDSSTESDSIEEQRSDEETPSPSEDETLVTITVKQPVQKALSVTTTKKVDPNCETGPGTGNSNSRNYTRIRMVINGDGALYVPRSRRYSVYRGRVRDLILEGVRRQRRAGIIVYTTVPSCDTTSRLAVSRSENPTSATRSGLGIRCTDPTTSTRSNEPIFRFGMGVDSRTKEITDFGGGVTSKDKTVVEAAVREFHEETLQVFGLINQNDLGSCPVFWNEQMMIIMVHLDMTVCQGIDERFLEARSKVKHPEIDQIVWYSQQELMSLIRGGIVNDSRMYDRVRRILHGATNFYPML